MDNPPPDGYGMDAASATRRRRAATYYRVIALIWFVAGLIAILIAGRFLCLLLGASTTSGFVTFLYAVTGPLVAPFEGIFGTPASGAHVFETAALVAIVVYLLIAAGIVTLIRILSGRRQPDAV